MKSSFDPKPPVGDDDDGEDDNTGAGSGKPTSTLKPSTTSRPTRPPRPAAPTPDGDPELCNDGSIDAIFTSPEGITYVFKGKVEFTLPSSNYTYV